MESKKYSAYAPSILRLVIGLLFIIPGFQKLANPSMIIGMLGGLGFPAPLFFGWLLLLSEIVFGALIIVGWRIGLVVWPLITILGIATITVHIPRWLSAEPMGLIFVIMHFLGIAALLSIFLTGPGAFAIKKMKIVLTDSKEETPMTEKATPSPEQE